MKRSTLLLILPILFLISSCEKREYVTPNRTIIVNLGSGSWISSNGGKTYTAAIDMPEIDGYFNENGAVLVYASFGSNIYEQVPEVYNGIAYSFTHRVGQVALEIQASDGKTVITPPGSVKIKVVLVESY
ncbi:hypothetical protein [Hufsiella ginkgonis]|uniref:Uncharacterized protein n=1 Tax=Hufsiella ginkgonis TaxID=2695274 RepID=A0A7K1XVX1_9SPHI|nr:hypothetical protein [Hufsiella ginkgonis]MXV14919.1 hypothetical protein [Hufsiella ginkgonis]